MYLSAVILTSLAVLFLAQSFLAILSDSYDWIISLSIIIETFYIAVISFVLNSYDLV